MVAASTGWWPMRGFIPLHANKEPPSTLVYLPRCDKRFNHCCNREARWRCAVVDGGSGDSLPGGPCHSSFTQLRLASVAFALLISVTPKTATF